jgi:GTP-sensing pleiotropic transcriptional regulator CodY
MDRILSTRIDDAVYRKITYLSSKMHTSKKMIIEKAVSLLGQHFEHDKENDVFAQTCGVWKSSETPAETVVQVKTRFRESMHRLHR